MNLTIFAKHNILDVLQDSKNASNQYFHAKTEIKILLMIKTINIMGIN